MMQKFYSFPLSVRTFIGIVFATFAAFFSIQVLNFLFSIFFSLSLNDYNLAVADAMTNLRNTSILQSTFLVQSVSVFLVPSIVLLFAYSPKPFKIIGLNKSIPIVFIVGLIAYMFLFTPGINLVSYVNTSFVKSLISPESLINVLYQKNEALVNVLMQGTTISALLVQVFFMAVVPAFTEEFFFRGMMQNFLLSTFKKKATAIVITAALFSIMHGDLFNFFPRFLLGLVFGYAYIWTGNLLVPIIAHFFNNAMVVIVRFAIFNQQIPEKTETIGFSGNYMIVGIVSVLLISAISYYSYKKYNPIT